MRKSLTFGQRMPKSGKPVQPTLRVFSFSGDWGHRNSYGSQNFNPVISGHIYPYTAQLNLSWTIFDGGARRNELLQRRITSREAQAQTALSRDQIENEIWTAYSNLRLPRPQQAAAIALLEAAEQSYNAATEAFQAGVRTFIDVTTAQRDLARARTAAGDRASPGSDRLADLAFRAGDPIHGRTALNRHLFERAPSVDVFGSFFPIWMFCIVGRAWC